MKAPPTITVHVCPSCGARQVGSLDRLDGLVEHCAGQVGGKPRHPVKQMESVLYIKAKP